MIHLLTISLIEFLIFIRLITYGHFINRQLNCYSKNKDVVLNIDLI